MEYTIVYSFRRGHLLHKIHRQEKCSNTLKARKVFQRLSDGDTRNIILSTEGRVLKELTILTAKDKRVLLKLTQQSVVPHSLVLNLARSLVTPPEVLQKIARRSSWVQNRSIRRALIANGKTPHKVKESLKASPHVTRNNVARL